MTASEGQSIIATFFACSMGSDRTNGPMRRTVSGNGAIGGVRRTAPWAG